MKKLMELREREKEKPKKKLKELSNNRSHYSENTQSMVWFLSST
jgi:hypothetical protein